jgi:hypothetical protein
MHGVVVRAAWVVAAALVGAAAATVPVTAAHAAAGCEVSYTASTWPTSFYADVRIKNLGDTWNGYTVVFAFTAGQRITQGWNHQWTQSGSNVTARSTQPVTIRTGESISLGFFGSHTGVNPAPTNWSVNGIPCTLAGQPPAVIANPVELSVPEGGSGGFTVRLSHPPSQTLYLGMAMSGTGIWAAPPVLLVFTPDNWSNPQRYAMMSGEDDDSVDDRMVLTLSATGYASTVVTLTQIDND